MADAQESVQLTGQQRILYDALLSLDMRLAGMYFGALMVFNQRENPVRMLLTGHCLRELMDKLPKYLDVSMQAKPASLKSKARELANRWHSSGCRSTCHNNGQWQGEIDRPLRTFLGGTVGFIEWFEAEHTTRKTRTATTLRDLDALGRPLPKPIETLRVEEWDKCHDYFAGVAHTAAPEEFDAWVDVFERMLLDLIKPRTYEDHAAIDAIIKEGEQDGQP